MKRDKLVIVDMQYMFHRHLYRIRTQEERTGKYMLSWNGQETARLYFTLKDFFEIVRFASSNNADICVCLDSKSARKEENAEYKANRGKLVDVDVIALDNIERVVRECGFATFKFSGYEADDLIASVIRNRGSEYSEVIVFTPDSDLCAHVKDNVCIWRYKSVNSKYGNNGKHADFLDAHDVINVSNLSEILTAEFKTEIPYNAVMLYKSLVGDTSDHIPGVKGFGKAAFGKYVANLRNCGVDFSKMTEVEEVERIIRKSSTILGEANVEQALSSLEMVKSRTCDEIEECIKSTTLSYPCDSDKMQTVLSEYGINSIKQ